MFPDTASIIDSQVPHFSTEKIFKWVDSSGWHVHDGSVLHIPANTMMGVIKKPNKKKTNMYTVLIQPNGSQDNDYEIRCRDDQKHIYCSQEWLKELLCSDNPFNQAPPKFLFLPLGHRICSATSSAENSQLIDNDPKMQTITKPESIGIVLVGKADNKKSHPMTRWHKFGNFIATGLRESPLDWDDGILVTSYANRSAELNTNTSDCERLQNQIGEFVSTLQRQYTDDPGWTKVSHDDIRRASNLTAPA
jgi:hypothetical protein